MQTYGKSIVAFLYAVAVTAVPLLTPGHTFDAADGIAVGIAVATALLTYLVPLVPAYPWTKTVVGAALAGLQVAAGLVVGGLDGQAWLSIALAVITGLGIAVAPASSPKTLTRSGAASLR
jgi:hypothetical protein